MDYRKKFKVDELTPVQNIAGMYFKREDLYMPFDDIPLSGGKVRQCINLIGENEDYIRNQCDSNVYVGIQMSSPQGIIVSRVCKEFGFNSTVFVGNTTYNSCMKRKLMRNVVNQGGKIDVSSKQAFNANLNATIRKRAEIGEKFFNVGFGFAIESSNYKKYLIDSIANQVQNIPNNLDYLVIPCGSCITIAGILKGIRRFNKNVKNVIGIQIAGYDRTSVIDNILKDKTYEYELRISKDYPYSKELNITLSDYITFDRVYEAKAYDYMMKYMQDEIKDRSVCFWVVGDSTKVRDFVYGG